MFCKNCGKEVNNNAIICPHCGVQVGAMKSNESGENTIAIVGFVLSFIIAIAGLICSVVGYRKAVTEGAPHKGLALAGIIISVASMALVIILYITVFSTLFATIAAI